MIFLSGSTGYLGSTVLAILKSRESPYYTIDRKLEELRSKSPHCHMLLHCAGVLRNASDEEVWSGNVLATRKLLSLLCPDTAIVFASSRSASLNSTNPDIYARSKFQAEQLVRAHTGSALICRFTALAGPSPKGTGRSFLTRIIREAVRSHIIRVPLLTRPVDVLDVREAAALMANSASIPFRCWRTIDGTSGTFDLFGIAGLVAACVKTAVDREVDIRRVAIAKSQHGRPVDPQGWQKLLAKCNTRRIPLENTIHDTINAILRHESSASG